MIILPSLQDVKVVELLKNGGVGVLPTDTIYGLAAVASNKDAVARLYDLKQRERKPGTLIAANIEQLMALGVDEHGLRAVAHLWPNSLSIVLPAAPHLAYLDQGLGDLAVRIPKDEAVRQVLEQTGVLVTSSANHPGEVVANNLAEAQAYFGDAVDFYVDGGDLSGRPASTVARWKDDSLEILRQGAATINTEGGTYDIR